MTTLYKTIEKDFQHFYNKRHNKIKVIVNTSEVTSHIESNTFKPRFLEFDRTKSKIKNVRN